MLDGAPLTTVDTLHNAKNHNSWLNFAITIAITLGSFLFGYSGNVISGALALPSFNEKFLYVDTQNRIGTLFGVFLAAGVVGAVIQSPLSDRYGRRAAMAISCVFHIVGAALAAGSVNFGMLLVARFIAGIGGSLAFTIAPMFIGELAPAHSRGRHVSLHVVGIDSGYLVCACLSLAFSYVQKPIQWRLNFIVNVFFALVLLVSLIWIPESPRWLALQGKWDQARAVLEKIHTNKHDPTGHLAHAEMAQIREQIALDKGLPKGYIHIFKTPSLRKRAFCTIIVWFTSMSTAILVIANLTPLLFAGLGFSEKAQFGLAAGWLATTIVSCFTGGLFVDRFGRVKFMVAGGFGCVATLVVQCALQAKYIGTTNKSGLGAAVAFFFFFAVAYNVGFDAGSFVYTAEIWPSHLRSEGVTIAMVTFYIFAIAYNVPASWAFATIGWKYYLVFIITATVGTIAIAFYLPETSGLTLEEIGIQFGETPHLRSEEEREKNDGVQVESVPVNGDMSFDHK